MNLESIENQVNNAGYYTFFREAKLFVGIYRGKDETIGASISDLFCYVYLSNDKYVVEHYDGAIPILEEFSSEAEVFSFIRKKFPL